MQNAQQVQEGTEGSSKTPTLNENFDINISSLPEKLGFTPEFLEEVEKVGGKGLELCWKLLSSHLMEG